ncbi:hypothetical protein, partial [Rhodoferax sp.]|uniref:hypothetical protein n=1 Tax=Rhodoferax sp. TaxID=50421 RepID=UPI0025E63767
AVLGESRFLVGGQGQGVLLHLCRLVRDDNTNASHAPGRDLFSVALKQLPLGNKVTAWARSAAATGRSSAISSMGWPLEGVVKQ